MARSDRLGDNRSPTCRRISEADSRDGFAARVGAVAVLDAFVFGGSPRAQAAAASRHEERDKQARLVHLENDISSSPARP